MTPANGGPLSLVNVCGVAPTPGAVAISADSGWYPQGSLSGGQVSSSEQKEDGQQVLAASFYERFIFCRCFCLCFACFHQYWQMSLVRLWPRSQ